MSRKSPQQKKRESYQKDRRNTYAESGAKSRFAIAQAKRNRRSRERAASHRLSKLAVEDPELAERLEGKAVLKLGGRWRKVPDQPLGEVLQRKLKRRVRSGNVPSPVAEAKAAKIRRKKIRPKKK